MATFFLIVLSLLHTSVKAQQSVQALTLEEAISATLQNNRAVQLAKFDEDIAASNYKQTDAIYLPQIGFSYTALNSKNPLLKMILIRRY